MSTVCDSLATASNASMYTARFARRRLALGSSPVRDSRAGMFSFVPIARTSGAPHRRLRAHWRAAPVDAQPPARPPHLAILTAADDDLDVPFRAYLAPAPPPASGAR